MLSFISRIKRLSLVLIMDSGLFTTKKEGSEGISELGHHEYVGGKWEELGQLQYGFLLDQGLKPLDILLDVACGALRAGRLFARYLDKGHYLGIEKEAQLVEIGIKEELGEDLFREKAPEFVISPEFEFGLFSKSPTYAIAISLFTHLTAADIQKCLNNLADHVKGSCRFYATFFECETNLANYTKSHAHLAFYYTRSQMEKFGRIAGWEPHYMGNWGHPAGQKMVLFKIQKSC